MKHLRKIIYALALLAAFACSKEQRGESGRVSFQVVSSQDLIEQTKSGESGSTSGSKVSDYTTLPQTSDFTLTITDTATEEVSWTGKVSEWTDENVLPAGSYTVVASYGSLEEEGFDKPYFTTGTKDSEELPAPVTFTVAGGDEPVKVTVPVVLGNTLIKFECDEYFNNYFKDYTLNLVRDNKTLAVFTRKEHIDIEKPKAAFIDGYKFKITGTLTNESGEGIEYTSEEELRNLKHATIYTVKMNLQNVGKVAPVIKIELEEKLTDVSLGEVELNED